MSHSSIFPSRLGEQMTARGNDALPSLIIKLGEHCSDTRVAGISIEKQGPEVVWECED